jgi:hypothetical protein
MDWMHVAAVALAVGVVVFCLGICVGTRTERQSWILRAWPGASHYVDGTFYVILPEEVFVRDYQLKPDQPVRWEFEKE